jgi:hypothetical protein
LNGEHHLSGMPAKVPSTAPREPETREFGRRKHLPVKPAYSPNGGRRRVILIAGTVLVTAVAWMVMV